MRLFMLGAGGHARSVADALPDGAVQAFVLLSATHEDRIALSRVMTEAELLELDADDVELVNGIGQIAAQGARWDVHRRLSDLGFGFRTVIHPSATMSRDASLGHGVQVLARAVVGPGAAIGDNTIVNTGAIVEHDCNIGRGVHVAPGAILCGDVTVGDGSMIGAAATIVPGASVGAGCQVGAGSVVLHDVPNGQVVVGVPARPLT